MARRRPTLTAVLTGALFSLVLSATTAAASDDRLEATMQGDHTQLTAARAEQLARESQRVAREQRLAEYERGAACYLGIATWWKAGADGTCPSGAPLGPVVDCEEGDTVLMPMWVRSRETPASDWSLWGMVDAGGCGVDLLPALTAEDFARLPLPAPALTMQPDRGWVLINVETIVWTDPTPVTLRTELLGYGITIEATPSRWTYDFGDGHDLTTRSPGTPYPDHDVFHIYEKAHDEVTVTLAAEWTGRYRVDGNPVWRDVDGTAVTTATTTPFEVQERRAHLVSGLCTDRPKPPDC